MPAPVEGLMSPNRALHYFNLFRMVSVLILLIMTQWVTASLTPNLPLGGWVWLYAALITLAMLLPRLRLPLHWTLTLTLTGDILLLVTFMQHYGGVQSGFGMMLLPFLAVAGMLVSRRIAAFYASLATLAVFGSVLWGSRGHGLDTRELYQAAMLAIACFVTAGITSLLGSKARASERLVAARSRELASLNRLNALVLQALREAVVVVDENSLVQHYNSRAERVFGRIQRESVLPELEAILRRWRQQGCPSHAQTLDINVRGQQLLGRMLPLAVGEVRLVVIFLQNVADLAAEAQRIKLTALGRLTANIAHEIRNPLAAISQAAELLGEDASDEGSRRLAAMVHANSRRINHLVEEVLQLNRRDRVKAEQITLGGFLTALVDDFLLANPQAAGSIATRILVEQTVRFDRGHLQQILTNLISNGWRYSSRAPGAVSIEVDAEAIRVRDDGPGVGEPAQSRLFEPFYTTESTGTGLGLYIARELAEANGAELNYQGPGGCFVLTLPKSA
ncbi:nitrogen regulation protein NR(II) [Vogesella sp. LIG4]|uniref:two-component system sensor histidine kinase NtrB n=1 Tax=Vogesella sp. LIG4 TaxID=1192162 RepID=UPI0008200423|nr:HAMP domain-containing sensor histidine kinase [Vogesella sp. LIG4]SCK12900.1 two-component system, NtrC family, sensor histidine kinase PilS [Vogesella sp. LIG4]